MARVEREPGGFRIVAESADELALLAHARARGSELPLRDALYPVSARALAVPANLCPAALELLRRDFERAAGAHQRALRRRRRFRAL